jgi:two-component system, oxyanion-binding sensor
MKRLRIGYVPLTDAAPLIIAVHKGFAADLGIDIELLRESSWSSIRDRLVVGQLDAAHCLAPLAIATSLGLSHIGLPLRIPQVLSLNGNGISVSARLAAELGDPLAALDIRAGRLVQAAKQARQTGKPLTFATVFRFSSHTLLLRKLFEWGGGALEQDVDLVVLPPPLMVEGLEKAVVDGICVGNPWNMTAVAQAGATLFATGHELMPDLIEKVLAVPAPSGNRVPEELDRLKTALAQAADWLSVPTNFAEAATILAAPDVLDCPADIIERGLSGQLHVTPGGAKRTEPQFIRMNRTAFPASPQDMLVRLIHEMARAGQIPDVATAISEIGRMVG